MERSFPLRTTVPPAIALLAARLLGWVAAWTHGFDPLRATTWVRWDSLWYLRIAREGYVLESCRKETGLPASLLCGPTGWFPGYPALIALVARLGVDPATAGVLLSVLAQGLFLAILWNGVFEGEPKPRNLLALAVAAFFPGAIYAQAVFPISCFLLCALAFLVLSLKGRMPAAAVFGAAAAFLYPTGFLLAIGYGVWLLWGARPEARDWKRLLPLAGVGMGFASVLGVMAWQTGRADAFFMTQAGYGYGLSDPLSTLLSHLTPLVRLGGPVIQQVTAAQTLFVVCIVAAVVARLVEQPRDPQTLLVGATVLTYWAFPLLLGGQLSLYRAESLLLPSVVILRDSSRPVLGVVLVASIALAWPMAVGFFQGTLV